MTQRQQIQKPHRMHPPLILQIPLHLPFQRRDVSQHIPMRDHHTLRFSSSAGSKYNLQNVIAAAGRKRLGRGAPLLASFARSGDFDLLKDDYRSPSDTVARVPPRTDPEPSLNLSCNPSSKLCRSPIIHRHHNYPTQSTSKERRNPLRAILPPKHHPLTPADPPRLQITGEPQRHLQNLPVSEPLHPVSTPLLVSTLIAMRTKVCQQKLC